MFRGNRLNVNVSIRLTECVKMFKVWGTFNDRESARSRPVIPHTNALEQIVALDLDTVSLYKKTKIVKITVPIRPTERYQNY
jgi:hypothetical protein